MALQNEFSWSKSRHGKFEECRRLYWYHYYGSWGGWRHDAPLEARQAYILKNLSSRQQWAGNVVHEQIAYALALAQNGTPPPVDVLVSRARTKMREDFVLSRRGAYLQKPKWTVGLVEHEYDEPVPDEAWRANWNNVEACLRAFDASSWPERARNLRADDRLPIDTVDCFVLDGVRVFAAPDFACRENGGMVLADWKTGQPRESDREQVLGYALYAQSKWGAAVDRLTAKLVYLAAGTEVDVCVDTSALEGFRATFRESVARMQALLRDPGANVGIKDDFPMTSADSKSCGSCSFRRMCERGTS